MPGRNLPPPGDNNCVGSTLSTSTSPSQPTPVRGQQRSKPPSSLVSSGSQPTPVRGQQRSSKYLYMKFVEWGHNLPPSGDNNTSFLIYLPHGRQVTTYPRQGTTALRWTSSNTNCTTSQPTPVRGQQHVNRILQREDDFVTTYPRQGSKPTPFGVGFFLWRSKKKYLFIFL